MRRLAALLAALSCILLALVILLSAGLPARTTFTGQLMGEIFVAPEIGAVAPPFTLPMLDGETVQLIDLRGAPVIINFWATWCEPCRVETPQLQAFHQANGTRIVAVNLGESPAIIRAWVTEFELTFDIALDADGTVATLYRLRGQPSTYVVSPEGVITDIFYGPVNEAALRAALSR